MGRNAIKVQHGIKWSAEEERAIHEVMARVLVADAKAEMERRERRKGKR